MRYRTPIGLLILGIALAGLARVAIPDNRNHLATILESLGIALLAGSATALLYEWRSAESMTKLISAIAAVEGKTAIEQVVNGTFDAVITRFGDIYRDYVPTRVFDNSSVSKEFNDFYNRWLIESDGYRYRGDIAATTTYQLHRVWSTHSAFIGKNRSYSFLLMDPRSEESFLQRAHISLEAIDAKTEGNGSDVVYGDEKEIERRNEWAQDQIQGSYVSLYCLLMTARRYRLSIDVGLYSEVPFYRCELTHDGMFINYYIRGAFAGTFFYKRGSLLYHAFSEAFDLAFEQSTKVPDLHTISDEDFVKFLRERLAFPDKTHTCKEVMESLFRLKEQRFADLKKYDDVFELLLPTRS